MQVGKIGGIRIRINLLFLLLCVLYAVLGLGIEIIFILAAVLIHEISHVITARLLGVRVMEIELLPFGGQAKIEDFTGLEPDHEIYIALSGPIVSLSLAGIFYILQDRMTSLYLPFFLNVNLFLGLFNLCPALPMDGGRVLRALWSQTLGYKIATQRAAALGKILALVFMAWGFCLIFYQHSGANYIVIGILLFWSARREGQLLIYAFMRYLINKKGELTKHGVLPAQQIISRLDTPLKRILETTRPNYYLVVMVVDESDHLIGMRSESEIIECFFEKGPGSRLGDC